MINPLSSTAGLVQGETLDTEALMQGLLLPSGNDAAYVLAVAAGRAILGDSSASARDALDAFVAEMNAQAQTLGLVNTQFRNPDGFDASGHYTCAADLMIIARLAMENSTIARISSIASTRAHASNKSTWKNSNELLHKDSKYYCADAVGLKTGHTDNAGRCLISAFQTGDSYLIVCVLGSTSNDARYEDTLKIYNEFK